MYLRVSETDRSSYVTLMVPFRHVLSSVSRVATRDSSKEVAGTHDLFIALCEDDAIYPVFKVSRGKYRVPRRVPV
jgi:hypothetical protein